MAVTEPVTLAEAKAQCRVEFDDDDELISSYITAARQYVESFLNKPLVQEEMPDVPPEDIPDIPPEDVPETPETPETTETTEETTATNSEPVADDTAAEPSEDIPSEPSAPSEDEPEPEPDPEPEPIVVKQTWKQAILLLVADWYAHRENSVIGATVGVLPFGVHALLWPDRNVPV